MRALTALALTLTIVIAGFTYGQSMVEDVHTLSTDRADLIEQIVAN